MKAIRPEGVGWMSPDECWEKLAPRMERRQADPATMQYAFLQRKRITVVHGEIGTTFGGRKFHYRLLDQPLALMALNGCVVEVGFDPLDLETVAVYHDGRFVGLAVNAELREMGKEDFVADERDRRATMRTMKQWLAAIAPAPGLIDRVAHRRRQAVEDRAPAIAAMPAAAIAAMPAPEPALEIEREELAEEEVGGFDFYGSDRG